MSSKAISIRSGTSRDARYSLAAGAGSDAVHHISEYCLAVTLLQAENGMVGTGISLTLGAGNRIVCDLIDLLLPAVVGKGIEELMAQFGAFSKSLADHPQLRWLGPHKGAVHLALASIVNACFDLWAKSRGVPLWRLLLDLSPQQVVSLLDLSYLEDACTSTDCLAILHDSHPTRGSREAILRTGYPGYDTSVGWFRYEDRQLRINVAHALDAGFRAFKLKVGSISPERDLRRAYLLREVAGNEARLMFDANQQWSYPQAVTMCRRLGTFSPYWIEEPTHPDDILAHQKLARLMAPLRLAAGEHVPNRIVFKNYMEAAALHFVQVDCTRVAGISEFIAVSLLARKYNLPVAPHIGDMGQIHQHLVLFNHIAMQHPVEYLEYIPHLEQHFVNPAIMKDGRYQTPSTPGTSADLMNICP